MNILFYLHQYPAFGGIETVTTTLANQFVKDGHNVLITSFVHKDGTDLLKKLAADADWVSLPDSDLDSPANVDALLGILDKFRPNKIIFQDSYANIQATLFAAIDKWEASSTGAMAMVKHSVHPICVEHNMPSYKIWLRGKPIGCFDFFKRMAIFLLCPYFSWRRFLYGRARRKNIMRNSEAYVVLSRSYFPMIRRFVGKSYDHKLYAIPNPILPLSRCNLTCKKQQVVFAGSLIKTKGVDRLLDIWARLECSNPTWEFLIIGDGAERIALETKAKQLNLRKVKFLGFKRDTGSYFKDAALIFMASDFEGWPMVLGEAMQQGCVPIVFDSFAAASDIIDNNKTGRIIRHFNYDSFVNAANELMRNIDKRNAMAIATTEKSKEYDVVTIAKKWYSLFAEMKCGGGVGVMDGHK